MVKVLPVQNPIPTTMLSWFWMMLSMLSFLDALASLDLKLSVSESRFFTASASTGLSDYLFGLTYGRKSPFFLKDEI